MLTISIILFIIILSFKILKPVYINRISILISIYCSIILLTIIFNTNVFYNYGISIYNSLGYISINQIIGQLIVWFTITLVLLLGESGKTRKNILRSSEYTLIILLSILGMNFLLISNDLVTMSLAIELISFPLYISASLYKNDEIYEGLGFNKNNLSGIYAGLKYLLIGSLGSVFILLGSVFIYGDTGLTNITNIIELLNIFNNKLEIYKIGSTLIIVGLLLKLGCAPFHNWAPDVYDGVPTIVTTWISIVPKIPFLIFLSLHPLFIYPLLSNLTLFSSFCSLIIGSIMGLLIFRIKRLLAYSSIVHLGFILLSISCIYYINTFTTIFYIVVYVITSINIFFILNSINLSKNIELLSELKGFVYNNKLLSFSLIISFFSLAGIPPFLGFYSKYFILLDSFNLEYYFITFISLLCSVISCVYYLRIIKIINFDDNIYMNYKSIHLNETISIVISFFTFLTLTFVLNGNLIFNLFNTPFII
uniref:NADH-ubiquinone oxidoreductase chain 2 n=1 Tax=Zancudomyces culisetae TaxID=1213189 RepID=Q3T4D0_ZANCU|nr:NADH dehydrogenase subunit 2 [Zancudomyces culisetae]AAW49484.1 NADH dehydrogenase subunit 2 [Zancudomyces culisetae]